MNETTTFMHFRAGKAYGEERTCGNKVRYSYEATAGKAAASMNKRTYKTHDLESYPCIWCDKWHIGRELTPEEMEFFSKEGSDEDLGGLPVRGRPAG